MKRIARALCVLAAAVLTLAGLVGALAQTIAIDPTYVLEMADDAYVKAMTETIREELHDDALFYGIDSHYLTDHLDEQEIRTACEDYFKGLYQQLSGREKTVAPAISTASFEQGMADFAATFENPDEMIDEQAAAAITQACADKATALVNVTSDKYVNAAAKILTHTKLRELIGYWPYCFGGASVLAILCVVIPGAPILSRATLGASALFVPSLMAYVFVALIKGYDFKTKLALSAGPFKLVIDRLITEVETVSLAYCGTLALVTGVVFLILLIFHIRNTIKR